MKSQRRTTITTGGSGLRRAATVVVTITAALVALSFPGISFSAEAVPASLAQQFQQQREKSAQKIPAEVRRVMQEKTAELARSGLVEKSLGLGAKAPDFELPNATGKTVRLSDLLQHGPVVLAFYRGGWCPYCNLELRALQKAQPDIENLGAQLVAVSPQTPDFSLATKQQNELQFQVLSDAHNSVARRFGLVFTLPKEVRSIYKSFGHDLVARNGDSSFELPLPATYVIGQDQTVRFAFVNADYTKRAEPADILAALRQLRRP